MKLNINKYLTILIVMSILIISISETTKNTKVVETYCSTKHQNSVNDYKECKKLTLKGLVIKMTEVEKAQNNDIVPLVAL